MRWSKPARLQLGALPPPASPVRAGGTRHPSARSRHSFCCKTACTSKCFWPSVRHRQRFPISLILLTLIYFKILSRKKNPNQPTPRKSFLKGSHPNPSRRREAGAEPCKLGIKLCFHTEPVYSPGDGTVTDAALGAGTIAQATQPGPPPRPGAPRARRGGALRRVQTLAERSYH